MLIFGLNKRWHFTSLKNTKDETLFLEIALGGYDLSRLRDDEPTGEVVRIDRIGHLND